MRSWSRLILLTAAAISGMIPGASAASASVVGASDSSQSRSPPTVRWAITANAARSWLSTMSRVTSSLSYATTCSARKVASGRSASAYCAATRSSPDVAATPASTSPLRSGEALASSVLRSGKA